MKRSTMSASDFQAFCDGKGKADRLAEYDRMLARLDAELELNAIRRAQIEGVQRCACCDKPADVASDSDRCEGCNYEAYQDRQWEAHS